MPRLVPAILTVAAVVGGCGGSHSPSARSSNSGGAALTRAQVASYAHEVNLQPSDVPGATPSSAEGETTPSGVIAAAPRCGTSGVLAEPGTIHSARFVQGLATSTQDNPPPLEYLLSTVRIASSAALAARDIAADQTARVRDCIERVLLAANGERGPLVRQTDIVSLRPAPLPAGHDSFALAVTFHTVHLRAKPGGPIARPDGRPSSLEAVQDILGFASGPAEVTLTDVHEVGHDPAAKEQHLLSLLYTRAEAHNP